MCTCSDASDASDAAGRRCGASLGVALLLLAASARAQPELQAAYAAAERLRLSETAATDAVAAAYGEALDLFLRLARDNPDREAWRPAGAFCAFQAGDFERAADLFGAVVEAGSRSEFDVGYLLRSQSRAGRAEALVTAALRFEPVLPAVVRQVLINEGALVRGGGLQVADRWLRHGDRARSLWVFRYQAEYGGQSALDLANLALALRHLGEVAESEATYRRALQVAPDDAILWNDLGLLLKGAGRTADAARALLESRRREAPPNTGPATTNLVLLGQRTGRHTLPDAAEALARVLAERPAAALARRAYLDALAARRFSSLRPAASPDRRSPSR